MTSRQHICGCLTRLVRPSDTRPAGKSCGCCIPDRSFSLLLLPSIRPQCTHALLGKLDRMTMLPPRPGTRTMCNSSFLGTNGLSTRWALTFQIRPPSRCRSVRTCDQHACLGLESRTGAQGHKPSTACKCGHCATLARCVPTHPHHISDVEGKCDRSKCPLRRIRTLYSCMPCAWNTCG